MQEDLILNVQQGMEVVNIASGGTSEPDRHYQSASSAPSASSTTSPFTTVPRFVLDINMTGEDDDSDRTPSPPVMPLTPPTTDPNIMRPMDILRQNGPPADPIEFSRPRFERGIRAEVLCYIPAEGDHKLLKNVLFRDYSREPEGESALKYAYCPLPGKPRMKTIMGYVEVCVVLERCPRDDDSQSIDGEEEDIVFQLTDRYVAVKVNSSEQMDKLRNRHAEDPLKEVAAMQLVGDGHPNVLGCQEVLFDGKNLNVVLHYCNHGDLFGILQENMASPNPGLSEGQCRYWMRQLMKGVQYLHQVGICHRDLSPENVMIDQQNCLIIDFGMALRVPYTDPTDPTRTTDASRSCLRRLVKPQGACGKLPYMSPEIYRSREPFDTEAVDVWTCGTILFCMVTGNRSYERPHSTDAQFFWMTNGLDKLLDDWNCRISPEGLHLLQNMLQVDPRQRLTIDEILQHPWFTYPDEPVFL